MPYYSGVPGAVMNAATFNANVRDQTIDLCTSATRPATPTNGQQIFETDTGRLLRYRTASGGVGATGAVGWVGIGAGIVTVEASKAALCTVGVLVWCTDTSRLYMGLDEIGNYALLSSSGGSSSFFGSGVDGGVTLDGTASPAGFTKTGNTYTQTRDVFGTVVTVAGAATVLTNGWRLFASTSLTNAGIIHSGATAGVSTVAGTTPNAGSVGGGMLNGLGGVYATFGGGTGGTGGGGVAASAPSVADQWQGGTSIIDFLPQALLPVTLQAAGGLSNWNVTSNGNLLPSQPLLVCGGSAGTVGASTVAGAGGGGGGVCVVSAPTISNSGTIHAGGGAGGAGVGTNKDGGGGGGGGILILVSRAGITGAGSFHAAGGAGGARTGTGIVGAAGSNGVTRNLLTG